MQYFFVFNQAFYCSKQNIRFPLASRSKQFPLSPPFQAIPSLVPYPFSLHPASSPSAFIFPISIPQSFPPSHSVPGIAPW